MKFIDLEKLFQKFLQAVVKKYPEKYGKPEALEDDLGKLSEKFERTPNPDLDNVTPTEYVDALARYKELYDYVSDCLDNDIEVTDLVCDFVVRQPDCVEYLNGLLYEKNPDSKMLGAMLLAERGGEDVEDIFIKLLTVPEMSDEIITVAYEFLSEGEQRIADKILKIINEAPIAQQGILVEILSYFKGRKDVYFWLVTMLQRAEDVPLYAGLLGAYGDASAVDIMKSFAVDNDINYVEYVELRNAVEELGGEFDIDKDFSEDPYYKYMNSVDTDGAVEDTPADTKQ